MTGFKIGDKVVKNPLRWHASEFDAWGAGKGVGRIVAVAPALDVVWPTGRSWQHESELMPAPSSARFARSLTSINHAYRLTGELR